MLKWWLVFVFSVSGFSGTISGKISAPGGDGLEGVTLNILDTTLYCVVGFAETDANGNYTSSDVPNGDYYVWIAGPTIISRYHGNNGPRTLADASVVNVSGSTTLNMTARLGASISGQLTVSGGSIADTRFMVLDPFSLTNIGDEGGSLGAGVVFNGDGTFVVSGLEAGCYLLGAAYDPDDLNLTAPVVFYAGGNTPDDATLITVTEGQVVNNADFSLNTADLGTLALDFTVNLNTRANISLVSEESYLFTADTDGSTTANILLPPGTYQMYVDFDETFTNLHPNQTYTLAAGQTQAVSLTPTPGGAISGTVMYDVASFAGQNGQVQAIHKDTGNLAGVFPFSVLSPTGSAYEISGLPDGDYLVRTVPSSGIVIPGLPGPFQRIYHPAAINPNAAATVTLSGGSSVAGIDMVLVPGGAITGTLRNGDELASPVFIAAAETSTGEVFEGTYLPSVGYSIPGLPPGQFRVAVNGGLYENGSLGQSLGFATNLLCSNIAPSFYDNADDFASADLVTVAAGATVPDIDINVNVGGGISGRVVSCDGDHPVLFGFLGISGDNYPLRLTFFTGGQYEINGLPPGTYDLKLALPLYSLLNSDIDPADLEEADIDDIFDLVPSFDYSGTISVSSTGSITQLPEWCINTPASGSGNGGGGGGGGGTTATEILYPWVSNNANQFESILIANNFGSTTATVTLEGRRSNGNFQSVERTIPAGGFLKERASSLFDDLGDGAGYSVLLTSESEDLTGRWVTNNLTSQSGQSPSQGVAVNLTLGGTRVGEELIFGYLPITNNFISAPVICNTGEGPTTVNLTFYNEAGQQVGTETLTDMTPFVPFATAVNNLVTTSGDIYMTAQSDREAITGVAFVFNNVGETAIGNATAIDTAANDTGNKSLIYPWVSNNEGAFESVFVVNNYGDSTAMLDLTARRETGDPETVQAQIPAHGFLQMSASELFPTLGSGSGYTVEVTADRSKVEGQWVTNLLQAASGASPSQGVAVDANQTGPGQRADDTVMFGFLPLTESFVSAPVVVNLGANPTDITLYFYDENGNEVHRDTEQLMGISSKRPFARVANNLVPEGTGDVYMVARSNDGSPLTGVVFVFNADAEPAIGNVTGINFNP